MPVVSRKVPSVKLKCYSIEKVTDPDLRSATRLWISRLLAISVPNTEIIRAAELA
jgi:hypothetical protein